MPAKAGVSRLASRSGHAAHAAYTVCAGLASDVGRVRRSNEDALAFVCPDDIALRRRLGVLAVVALSLIHI